MAQVELNIVALGDFSSVNAQIKSLQEQVSLLQKNMAGVGVSSSFAKELSNINATFKQTMLSTGQFTASTVKMTSETEKFGQALVNGKLKLTEYYSIIKQKNSEAVTQMKALAVEQTKLQNSIIMNDPSKQGLLSIFTPTQIDKVANATKIATHEANLYAIAVQKGSEQLITWGKNTQWAGRQLTVGMSVPLMIFGQQATKVFTDVNNELVRLQKVYGTGLVQPSQQALDTIKTQVTGLAKELASTMGVAAKDTAAMAADLAATGKTGNDLLVATREAMRLSKLGELDTQAAMKATVSLQNVYKLSTQQLSGAIDFLNAVENQTSTSLQDLVDGIPRVGPIVQQLGGSFKDTAVMMVAMKEAGVPAAQSANAIKSAIASLINPTVGAQKAFAAFHINLKGIAASTGGNPVEMIMQLQKALKGLAPLAQAQLIEKLFGKFQEARIQALISNLGANNSQTKTAFDLMNANSQQLASVAAGEMKTATESVTGKYQRTLQTFKANLIPVGQELVKIATKLLDFGNSVGKVFSGLPGPLKSVMGAIAIGIALSGPIIMLTGLFANFAGYVLKGFFNLKQLATGGKTLGQLLTPELIAAENANKLFQTGLTGDVAAVNLLSKAIQDLTLNIQSMVGTLSAGTGFGSVLGKVATTAKTYEQMKLPGFASGGVVPGSGNQDTFPAMLTPGESIIPKGPSAKYAPLIQAMITGNLPHFAKGVKKVKRDSYGQWVPTTDDDPLGEEVTSELMHLQPSEDANRSWLQKAKAAISLQRNSKGKQSLDEVNEVEPTFMMPGPGPVNQATRSTGSGMTGAEIADHYKKLMAAGVKPIEYLTEVMTKLGIPLKDIEEKHVPKLQAAFETLIKKLETDSKNVRFGTNPKIQAKPGESLGGSFESEFYKGMEQPLSEIEATGRSGRRISLKEIFSRVLSTRGASATRRTDRTYNPLDKSNTGQNVVIQDDGSLTSYDESFMAQEFPNLKSSMFKTSGTSKGLLEKLGLKKSESSKGKLPKASVFDIDQTLAKTSGINSQGGSWIEATLGAAPIEEEVANLRKLKEQGHKIVLLTARHESMNAQTLEWLEKNNIPYDELIMRGQGSPAGDGPFKQVELANLQKRYDVKGLHDDKQENLDAAKSLGIPAIPAANGITEEVSKRKKSAKDAGKQIAESYAEGVASGKAKVAQAGAMIAKEAIMSVAKTQKSASKSVVAEQLAMDFGDGYYSGLLSSVSQVTTAGKELAMGAITGAEETIGENIGGENVSGGRFSKFKNKFMPEGKMGNMLKFGASSAIMMGGQAVSGMLPKGSNLSAIGSDAAAGASLGMFLGPEGAAAGAAIGAALGGISALIKADKEHKSAVEASFKSSADVVSMYGGKIIEATQAVYNFNTASKQTSKILSQTAKDVAGISKADSNNPLKKVGDLIKGYDTASSVIGTVKSFAAAQVAAGMDPKQVSQMVTDLLTYANKTQYLDVALKEITSDTKNMTSATTTYLTKLKNTNDASLITAKSYGDMSNSQKLYSDALLKETNIISNQSTPFQVVIDKIKALSNASSQGASDVNGLALALEHAGAAASTVNQLRQWATMGITDQGSIATLLRLSAAGFKNLTSKDPKVLAQNMAEDLAIQAKAEGDAQIAIAQKNYKTELDKYNAAVKAAKSAATNNITKAKQDEINALGKFGAAQYDNDQKLLKVKEAQLNTMKHQTSELQKQQQYQMSQQDLDSQIKLAQVSGDYLKAASLAQQKNYNAANFSSDKQQTALQDEIDALKQRVADAQLKISNYQSSPSSAGGGVDHSGVDFAAQQLALAKSAGSLTTDLTNLKKYLASSGLNQYSASIDPVTGGLKVFILGGKIDSMPAGTPGNPTIGTKEAPIQSGTAKAITKAMNLSVAGGAIDLSTWNQTFLQSGTAFGGVGYDVRAYVKKYAKEAKIKPGQYFEIDSDTHKYVFLLRKDSGVDMVSDTPIKKATGGHITGPGTGTSDSIPAYLSNGEYVVKADSVKHYGTSFFDSVNAKKFKDGGHVWDDEWKGMKAALDFMGVTSLANIFRGKGKKSDALSLAAMIPAGKIFKGAKELSKLPELFHGSLNEIKVGDKIFTSMQGKAYASTDKNYISEWIQGKLLDYGQPANFGNLYKVKPILNDLTLKTSGSLATSQQGFEVVEKVASILKPSSMSEYKRILEARSKGLIPSVEVPQLPTFPKPKIVPRHEWDELATGGYILNGKVKLPSFAVGTDYVPHDMIAQIHKGERIIPASENNGTMVGHTFNINIDGARYTDPDKLAKIITDTVIAKLNVNSSKVNVTNRVGRN